ncbi:MAG: cobA [Rickettsiales bacterium]|jgi:uroporphyrin-III C-methyltransferase/precorrin-2 dehydrogenase/sirohydrochlorin ferrochelatase/uroporphyrin-III C-methyltransferase|nr:cobA [Rickettsiales bacterium]
MSSPFVSIVGAGPGDPELLTLKAHRRLQEADVVIYDRLISEEILKLIPSRVEKIYAGKSCRTHHMTQEEINACLVEEAGKGRRVVRLKGGDPFIFGRGGEEAETLVNARIPFEIVPGVNAADGCAAYQGIPLTHRGLATGVRFITGHQQKGEPVALDWRGLADPHTTLVVYMGLANLEEITSNLIEHGLPKDTPAAAIQEGTTVAERLHISTLQNLSLAVTALGFVPPTLIIIGKVVGLAETLKPSHVNK